MSHRCRAFSSLPGLAGLLAPLALLALLALQGAGGHRPLPDLLRPAAALADPTWDVARFEARIEVDRRGRLQVVETLRVRFGPEPAGARFTRILPREVVDPAGFRTPIDVHVEAVTDGEGRVRSDRVARTARDVRIEVGDERRPLRGEEVIVLHYEVEGAVLRGGGGGELYWNVTGHQWAVPIVDVEAVVTLPAGAGDRDVVATSLVSQLGRPVREADVKMVGASQVRFAVHRGLGPHESLSIAVVWPDSAASAARPAGPGSRLLPVAAGVTVGLLLLAALRRRR